MKRKSRYESRNDFFPTVRRVFFIYTEASAAAFMLCGALFELLCGYYLRNTDPLTSWLGYHAAAGFALIGLLSALWVMYQARKHGIIGRG